MYKKDSMWQFIYSIIVFIIFEIVWNIFNEFPQYHIEQTNIVFLLFYLLIVIILFSEEPIKALLSLICCFFFAMGLIFYYCSFTFLPLVILILYVGAIAILFLFVVMLFNHPQNQIEHITPHFKKTLIMSTFFFSLIIYFRLNSLFFLQENQSVNNIKYEISNYIDINIISEYLYNKEALQFLIVILILLSILFAIALICRRVPVLTIAGSLPLRPVNSENRTWSESMVQLLQVWSLNQWILTIMGMFSLYYLLFLTWNRFARICKIHFGIKIYILSIRARTYLLFFDLIFNLFIDICVFYYMPGGTLEELIFKCPISLSPFILIGEIIFVIIFNIYIKYIKDN